MLLIALYDHMGYNYRNGGTGHSDGVMNMPFEIKSWLDLRDGSYAAAKKFGYKSDGVRVEIMEAAQFSSPRAAKHIGDTGTLRGISNDGFNGMMAFVELDTPDDIGKYVSLSVTAIRPIEK